MDIKVAQVSHNFCLALMFVSNLLLAAEKKKKTNIQNFCLFPLFGEIHFL